MTPDEDRIEKLHTAIHARDLDDSGCQRDAP
jgi:hypothetical protein